MTTELSPLEFKSATLYAIRVVLQHADTKDLIKALKKRMADAGAFFENEPVVIDATRLDDVIDWPPLIEAFKKHKLPVIGVVAQGDNLARAQACGLTPVDLSAAPARHASDTQTAASVAEPVTASLPTPAASAEDTAAKDTDNKATTTEALERAAASPEAQPVKETSAAPTMVIKGPLRSGQRVYARNSDLIVMGVVSRGAEVIADGNIHIYGPLRGKAMAGARGDIAARIFTTGFDAELVAVAGIYRVIDTKLSAELHQKPVVIQLEKDALHINALGQ
ncbi:septum site-determining protein MinC [Zwartia vadi]|uniref:septum site-determining protein MinC n=1 Tax=Zwartia vadi TaxID=3058168 RepID=UPI0025B624CC|nr:septum site-determining protein MinC [Zwartia vadi]MDN3986055.1 septum site-determining protein MinC [Zwartia vadi]